VKRVAAGDLAADAITGDSYSTMATGRVCAMQMSVNGIPSGPATFTMLRVIAWPRAA